MVGRQMEAVLGQSGRWGGKQKGAGKLPGGVKRDRGWSCETLHLTGFKVCKFSSSSSGCWSLDCAFRVSLWGQSKFVGPSTACPSYSVQCVTRTIASCFHFLSSHRLEPLLSVTQQVPALHLLSYLDQRSQFHLDQCSDK
jgi:hypothetical protein